MLYLCIQDFFFLNIVHLISKRLTKCIVYFQVYNFADDTAILYTEIGFKTSKKKRINIDLKLLIHWLKANKIHLNVSKIVVHFISKANEKKVNYNIKTKLDGKLMRFSKDTDYLGMIINDNLAVQ